VACFYLENNYTKKIFPVFNKYFKQHKFLHKAPLLVIHKEAEFLFFCLLQFNSSSLCTYLTVLDNPLQFLHNNFVDVNL